MNRNFRKFIIVGTALIAVIFIVPYIFPVNAEWYFSNLNWLIPLTVVIFIVPIVPFILSSWDIHFSFQSTGDNLIAIVSNYGANPYNFNRLQFASGRKYFIWGKREFYPQEGISDEDVEYHGADTPSHILHQHIGCTLRKGLPITLTIRNHKARESLRNFREDEKVYLSVYYEGSNQRIHSKRIPPEVINNILHTQS